MVDGQRVRWMVVLLVVVRNMPAEVVVRALANCSGQAQVEAEAQEQEQEVLRRNRPFSTSTLAAQRPKAEMAAMHVFQLCGRSTRNQRNLWTR